MHPSQFIRKDRGEIIKGYEECLEKALAREGEGSAAVQYYEDLIKDEKCKQKGDEGEEYVFNALRANLPPDWIVFHSRVLYDFHLTDSGNVDYRSEKSYNRELDFVIIVPDSGILVLEVKNWSKEANEKPETEPIEQARSAARTLKRWLTKRHSLKVPVVAEAVWMTQTSTDSQRRNPKYICGRDKRGETLRCALRIQFGNRRIQPENWDIDKVVELLSCQERYRISLDDYDRIMDLATAKVNNLLPMLSESLKGVRVSGCAGSGKTVMAVREAGRLAKEGERVLYVCFTHNLPIWLKKTYREDLKSVDVCTFHSYCIRVLKKGGLQAGEAPNDEMIESRKEDIIRLIQANPGSLQYKYIFVDEAQDFKQSWWDILNNALSQDSLEAKFYLFFDKNQYIRNAGSPPPLPVRISLDTNLRNSSQIAEYSSALLPKSKINSLELSCQEVEIHEPVDDLAGRNAKVREIINGLLSDDAPQRMRKKDIVVLSPFRNKGCFTDPSMSDIISYSDKDRLENCLFGKDPKRVLGETIIAFKGLEAPVIILTDFEMPTEREDGEVNGAFTPNSFYVACTRAKFMLHIIPTDRDAKKYAERVLEVSRHKTRE